MKFQNLFRTLLAVFCIVFISSCSDDDDTTFPPASTTIAEFVAGNPDYSSLLAALQKAELVETLSSTTSDFTVFAPNNAAFDAFLTGLGVTLDDLSKDDLTPILLNHVLGSEITSSQLTTGYVSNQAGVSAYVNTSNGVVINGDVTVTTADIDQSNGVIHAVDKVIPLPTMLTFAGADTELSSLAGVATTTQGFTTDFAAVLSGDTKYTLLAPTNAAFTALGDISGVSVETLEQILLNHVIAGENQSSGLSTGYGNTLATYGSTMNNLNIYINTGDGVSFNGISNVSTADIIASNGVIHKVDAVITLPTVVTFATADAEFSSLVAALTREADFTFVETLSTAAGTAPAPFTVFAPTNNAFTDLLTELSLAELADIPTATLSAALSYHVVTGGNVRAADITDGQVVTTLETGTFTINTTMGVVITDENSRMSNVTVTDVQAANGVIHVIDKVLLPM